VSKGSGYGPFTERGTDGRLAFHHTGGDTFATREWLAADADGRAVHDASLGNGSACDPSGCTASSPMAGSFSHALAPDALEEDCQRAVIVVTARDPPPGCAAMVVGRNLWRERGALTLRRDSSGFVMESARPSNYDRPWAPAPLPRHTPRASQASGTGTASESSPAARRDATHRGVSPDVRLWSGRVGASPAAAPASASESINIAAAEAFIFFQQVWIRVVSQLEFCPPNGPDDLPIMPRWPSLSAKTMLYKAVLALFFGPRSHPYDSADIVAASQSERSTRLSSGRETLPAK
jgi:hypothetical protein